MNDVPAQASTSIPLWLDCDPGHDDAFAILLAAHYPNLRLLGVSTIHGNASLEHTTWNALSVLTAIGRADVPVHPGAVNHFAERLRMQETYTVGDERFSRSSNNALLRFDAFPGKTGLDGTIHLPEPIVKAVERPNAVLAMRHALLSEAKGSAWLVATGALTNVALLFSVFPEVVGHIKGLSIMGGAIGGGFTEASLGKVKGEGERFGNWTPYSEFNIYCDPEAAQAIFSNAELAAKTTLIPLDLTHQVFATEQIQGMVQKSTSSTDIGQLFYDLLVFFAQTYRDVFGLSDGPPLHDPIAVAVLLEEHSDAGQRFDDRLGERWHINVVTEGLHSEDSNKSGQVGRTVARKAAAGEGGVRIPRKIETRPFWNAIEECLKLAQEAVLPS